MIGKAHVADVTTLDLFASAIMEFAREYAAALYNVKTAADDDHQHAKSIVRSIEAKVVAAAAELAAAEAELVDYKYRLSTGQEDDSSGHLKRLEERVKECKARLKRAEDTFQKGIQLESEVRKACGEAVTATRDGYKVDEMTEETSKIVKSAADAIRKYIS